MARKRADNTLSPVIEEAQRRGYLTIDGSAITYHCKRNFKTNWDDPEEKVRAFTYSWLIIQRSYSPDRIDFEVRVPRRTPNDYADIVVYQDDACRVPFLVVENKPDHCSVRNQRQAIEQGFGNANSLRAPYMLFHFGKGSVYYDVLNFPSTEREANRLGEYDAIPANYGTPSVFPLVAQGTTDISPVTSAELETRVRRAHALIWAGGKRDPLKSFDEWSKLLFAKIYDERHTLNGQPRRFQCGVGETATQVANRIRELFAEARQRDPSIFTDPHLDLPDDKLAEIVRVIERVALSLTPIDALGHAFEQFFGSIFRGDLGQYFTRRELVRFMVAIVRPTDRDFILDPTCGSGGFLLETLLQVWHFIDTHYAGQPDIERRKYDFAHENLFGIEIHEILGRVCQTNLLLHKDGHTNIETDRSCLEGQFSNSQIREGGFSIAIGNPPFGDRIKEGDTDALGTNTLASFEIGNHNPQVQSELIILEQSLRFLQPGGVMAMVVPDGLLNNPGEISRCPTFRRLLLRESRIEAVISLPDHAFRKSGAQNKTSILFVRKYTAEDKSQFDSEYADELATLRERDLLPEPAAQGVAATDDDDEVANLTPAQRTEAQLEATALRNVITTHDHWIFLAEADHIGYSPAGTTSQRNELYSLSDDVPDDTDQATILGQYRKFKHGPDTYAGTATPQCMTLLASNVFAAHPTYRLDPKFHLFERERLAEPPEGMRLARLGDLLSRRHERVYPQTEPDTEFLVPTLTQTGELSPRESGQGRNPPAWFGQYFSNGSRWFRIHEDDLLFSQIDLWKGCVAIVPRAYDAAIVTTEFPVYQVDTAHLDPHYLRLVLRSAYFQRAIRGITTGHSNRRRTQSYDFENLTVFVPLDEAVQRRISDAMRSHELQIANRRDEYQDALCDVDRLITGDISPDEFLANRDQTAG